jgi:hypothetical protein
MSSRREVGLEMCANGVRSLDVSCWNCRGADARPNWKEQPPRESPTGVQWR